MGVSVEGKHSKLFQMLVYTMGPGLVQEPPKFKILVKFTYFCPMEVTVYIPVKGKFGKVEYTISHFLMPNLALIGKGGWVQEL